MYVLLENVSMYASTDIYKTVSYKDSVNGAHHQPLYYIDRAGIVPISLLGIVGNLVSLVVWNKQPKYNASIFLFKYLAVWDTAFLVLFIPLIFLYDVDTESTLTITFNASSCLARLVSVHTTLLIAVCRWLAVYRPLQVHNGSLLGRRQIIVGCLVVFVWCVAVMIFYIHFYMKIEDIPFDSSFHDQMVIWGLVILPVVSLSIPILLLVVFNVLLIRKLRSPSMSSASSSRYQHQWDSSRRLTLSVVLMSLCTVLSYVFGEIFISTFRCVNIFHRGLTYDEDFMTAYSSVQLLQQINSSINIAFYVMFSHKFRTALLKCLSKCLLKNAHTH